jgi:hypothetical protein
MTTNATNTRLDQISHNSSKADDDDEGNDKKDDHCGDVVPITGTNKSIPTIVLIISFVATTESLHIIEAESQVNQWMRNDEDTFSGMRGSKISMYPRALIPLFSLCLSDPRTI